MVSPCDKFTGFHIKLKNRIATDLFESRTQSASLTSQRGQFDLVVLLTYQCTNIS